MPGESHRKTGVELRTARLLLRPFRAEDVAAFEAFTADDAYRRFLGADHPHAAEFVSHNLAIDWDRELAWVICLGDEVVGSIFLGVQPDDALAEMACLLAPASWGEGIALEAGRAVIAHAFGSLGIAKVWARAEAGNTASRRVMEKVGMWQEGLLRAHRLGRDGERIDEVMYGLMREEWRARP